jgi:TonB-dependent SusC/RagA subfamily outer membrane receptor
MKTRFIILVFLAASLPLVAFGQKSDTRSKKKLTITGFVTDAKQNPVAGAMIIIDKKNTNTFTNSKGFYKVKIRPEARLITAFSINNGVDEVLIEGRTTINFTLERTSSSRNNEQANVENDKTVNIGYGSIDPANLTTPVSSLDASDNKYASYPDIYEMLRGVVPGVEVRGKSIRIQGASSFMLSTEPLFVVDGIIVTSIDIISPSQVKSINVLKGASASIYGSRGANGVILIQLKGSQNMK